MNAANETKEIWLTCGNGNISVIAVTTTIKLITMSTKIITKYTPAYDHALINFVIFNIKIYSIIGENAMIRLT